MMPRALIMAGLVWTGPALAQEPLAEKMDKLAQELPKFSDDPEGIGVGVGVGEPMGLASRIAPIGITPSRRSPAGVSPTSRSIYTWTTS